MILQFLLLFFSLFGAGWAFGRALLFLPVLMSLVPFLGHINQQLHHVQSSQGSNLPFDIYLALSLGLGAILLIIGVVWSQNYPSSVFLFPLLFFIVYMAPWQYLIRYNLVLPKPSLEQLLFHAIIASFAILSYLLPMFLKLTKFPTLQPPSLDGR